VAQIPITLSGEGGLLGLAIHPNFSSNRWFYLYFTADAPAGGFQNKVERWILSPDGLSATFDAEIISDIPALTYHNGGRIKFGPDGYLYVGTGDAGEPALSQDINSLAGKILRVSDDGSVPSDNPYDGSLTWIYGVRNNQGFDWFDDGQIAMADHGPSGMVQESFRRDHDEFNIASSGDNLGWPNIYACETENDMVSPTMVWAEAMPPGGLAVYTGTEIPEWNGDVLIGVLGFSDNVPHLHRLQLDNDDKVSTSETYLRNLSGYGRLREVIMGPDGGLYVTTSNCDGRGDCGDGDRILRIGRN
jgi:glucose/arabinose dehydrogenase